MSQSTGRVFGPKPYNNGQPPEALVVPLAASVAPFKNWHLGMVPATGNVQAQTAGVTGLISVGYSDRDDDLSTTAGASFALGRWGFVSGFPNSAGASDAILSTDFAVPCWAASNGEVGKLSSLSGVNRSLLGLAYGLDADNATPLLYTGPLAWLLARATLMTDAHAAGLVAYPVDAGATTDIGSVSAATSSLIIPRSPVHGTITAIKIIPSAALSATSGNDRTITIWKIDALGVAAAVSVGTFTTTTALLARTAAAFTLSAVAGALDLLPTDILSYSTVHAASGAVIPQSAIVAQMKVL